MSGSEYLLDSNVVIGLLKGHGPALALVAEAGLSLGKASVSQITRMELLGFPNITDDEDRGIRDFLASCRVCLLDERIEAEAIRLRRSGAFKLPDAIIAATAIAGGLHLLTLDQGMVQGLERLGHEC